MSVCVVGAGIVGVASAIRLQDAYPELDITLISDKFSPETTGDGSAGFWDPVYLGSKNDINKLRKWGKETYDYIKNIWKSAEAGAAGVSLVTSIETSIEQVDDPFWKDDVLHFRHLSDAELKSYEKDKKLRYGIEFITFTCEPVVHLPRLMSRFTSRGGKLFQQKVTNLHSLSDRFDVVVNCSGLGAREMLQDEKMYPIRGQVMRVIAPHMKMCHFTKQGDMPNYCLVNSETVVLGGTTQYNNWNLEVDPDDERHIREGWNKLNPQLKGVTKVKDWVGLRPGRDSIRLEREVFQGKLRPFQVIHNYGHGGAGVTLFWGCAADVVGLMRDCLDHLSSADSKFNSNKLVAKL